MVMRLRSSGRVQENDDAEVLRQRQEAETTGGGGAVVESRQGNVVEAPEAGLGQHEVNPRVAGPVVLQDLALTLREFFKMTLVSGSEVL